MGKRTLLLISIISLVVCLESSIPYYYAGQQCRVENKFLGQVIFTPDQNMYFSFIRQAHDGHFLLNNKLTYLPNKPVFVNLEFWLVGAIQRITGISENAVYHVWRVLGILLLTIGFYMLARLILPPKRVVAALAVFLFTGGFGFVFVALNAAHLISLDAAHAGMFDMRYGFLPFMQAITNPHFSLPHGLILIAYACFLLAEQRSRPRLYILSGLLFCTIGLVRPYDIIPPFFLFPIYLYIMNRGSRLTARAILLRLLPLLMIVPVLLYNLWLFKVDEIFKYWSSQGHNAGSLPPVLLHYLAYGVVGILAIMRVAQYKRNPLGRMEQFLVLWFAVSFVFMRLGMYLPLIGWSPQIGVYLAVPLTLLAFSLRLPEWGSAAPLYKGGVAATVAVVLASNLGVLLYYTKNFSGNENSPIFYAKRYEVAAWQWMERNIKEGTVVLATPATSQRIAKYTRASVAAAHYSVTPRYEETITLVNNVFTDSVLSAKQQPLLQRLNAGYVYLGPAERAIRNIHAAHSDYLKLVYANEMVEVYQVGANR